MDDGWYSADIAMKRLGMSRGTFYAKVQSGEIQKRLDPGRERGTKYYVPEANHTNAPVRVLISDNLTIECGQHGIVFKPNDGRPDLLLVPEEAESLLYVLTGMEKLLIRMFENTEK